MFEQQVVHAIFYLKFYIMFKHQTQSATSVALTYKSNLLQINVEKLQAYYINRAKEFLKRLEEKGS